MPGPSSKRKRIVPLVVLLLLVGLGWTAYRRARAPRAEGGSTTIEGVDTVIASRIAARVEEVRVREGDVVKHGQVVARLDCREAEAALALARARLRSAEAQVMETEARVTSTRRSAAVTVAQVVAARAQVAASQVERDRVERDLGRTERLSSAGAISEQVLDTAKSRHSAADEQLRAATATAQAAELGSHASASGVSVVEASVEIARAAVEAARAEEARSRLVVDECTIVAPADGRVTARLVEPGAVLAPGSRVLTTITLQPARLTFFVANADLARANVGGEVTVQVDAYPGRLFTGTITKVAAEAEFTPRNVQTREDRDRLVYAVEVELPNTDGALRAGMPGEVTLPRAQPIAGGGR